MAVLFLRSKIKQPPPAERLRRQLQIAKLAGEIPEWEEEMKFHPTRGWRFDVIFVKEKIAVDVQGGMWRRGEHLFPLGYDNDMEKLAEAQLLGYLTFLCSPMAIDDGRAMAWIRRALSLTLPLAHAR